MRRHDNLFEKVCTFENLYNAYLKARKSKNDRAEVLRFNYDVESELIRLESELRNGTYKTGKYRQFTIFEPKERKIFVLPFRDRVVHHAVYSILYPIYDNIFIADSFACRENKGTHVGIERLESFIRASDNDSYVLKCDVSKYFPSVNHSILKRVLRKKIKDVRLLSLLDTIIDSAQEGIPIGNLTSQLFANIYLNELDYYVKHDLGVKYYLRYMDDFIVIHKSKSFLGVLKSKIKVFFESLKLSMHPKKANVFPLTDGVDFLGYRVFSDYRLARKSTVFRFLRNTKKKIKRYHLREISFDKLLDSFNSWFAYLGHANTFGLKKSLMARYHKNVF